MKLTKKQIAALNRIMKDGQKERMKGKPNGLHPSGNGFAITDGVAVVMFNEKPDGFPDADRIDFLSKYIYEFAEKSDCVLVEDDLLADRCKRAIREWKRINNPDDKSALVISLSVKDEKGFFITSKFDARKLLNVVEAMGTGALVYLGKDRTHMNVSPLPCVLVKQKHWMGGNDDYQALLLPVRTIYGGA